jgi:hypothetical protein
MPHYRLMYPSEYLNAADLLGKEFKVVIARVEMEEVPGVDGQKKSKPVVHFAKGHKRFPLPKTCAKVMAGKFGPNTEDWIGKTITVYPTTCQAFGQTVECVRVRV